MQQDKPMYSRKKITEIIEKIKESSNPDKIYLFGSYAYGKPNKNSDLDICVIKDDFKNKNDELSKIKKNIFNFGIAADILLFNKENFAKRQDIWGSVQHEIFKNGIKIYEK